MPYYHATHRHRLPSIIENGLGWNGAVQNWPGVARGVYLAEEPEVAVLMMVEHFLEAAPDDIPPLQALGEIALIVIDDSRVPRAMLGPDPSLPIDGIWLYRGTLDVRNMPVIGVDALMADRAA